MKSIGRDINSMSREELIDLIEVQALKMSSQLQWMLKRDHRIDELEDLLSKEKVKYKEIAFAFHHLKSAVAKSEVCGVPLHHLSYELSKHFSVTTYDFVRGFAAEAGRAGWLDAANSDIDFKSIRKEDREVFADIYSNRVMGIEPIDSREDSK